MPEKGKDHGTIRYCSTHAAFLELLLSRLGVGVAARLLRTAQMGQPRLPLRAVDTDIRLRRAHHIILDRAVPQQRAARLLLRHDQLDGARISHRTGDGENFSDALLGLQQMPLQSRRLHLLARFADMGDFFRRHRRYGGAAARADDNGGVPGAVLHAERGADASFRSRPGKIGAGRGGAQKDAHQTLREQRAPRRSGSRA